MSGWKKLSAAAAADSAILPEATAFNGDDAYLSTTSMTGNADGKTFTFSAFVYEAVGNTYVYHIDSGGGGTRFMISVDGTGKDAMLRIIGTVPGAGSTVLYVRDAGHFPLNTWTHVLCSFDMSDTSKRHIYINDVQQSVTYNDYVNSNIEFTTSYISIGGAVYSGGAYGLTDGRLAHVFLDYTYRNLTTESNRRLFITSDLKPADNQSSLSPIVYFPLTDATTANTNDGTGGNFTANGTFAQATRGPNQNNCVASDFDGSNDYMTKTVTQTDSSYLTCSFVFKQDGTNAVGFRAHSGATMYVSVQNSNYANPFRVILRDTSGSQICNLESSFTIPQYSIASVQVSLDISNASDRKVKMFLNGVEDTSVTETFYNSSTTYRLTSDTWLNRDKAGTEYYDGSMGEFYFDTAYIDLTSSNPFWDSDANLPKPLRQVLSETGNTPLIALPINAHNPGANLGTAGDFTVNTSLDGYKGARGGSEHASRSMKGNGSNGYLKNSSISNKPSSNKLCTMVWAFQYRKEGYQFEITDSAGGGSQMMYLAPFAASNRPMAYINAGPVYVYHNSVISFGNTWYVCLLSFDASDTNKRHFYVNGTSNPVWDTYNNTTIPWADMDDISIGARTEASNFVNDELSFMYFSNTYIDFSQKSNRDLFVDPFEGYPKNLTPAIEAGDIATPLVYMKFDDFSNLGVNSGNGGNFTVNGTVNRGGDVDP